ncbi:anti-sigma-factor antagonist [Gloeothece citriformis PCC 7424]|uniref:Anti-sigma factor antagonist n=1 Tax=Gloeothece citriformis (strain PCC 7424) TaxID=65393 RepID=B7KC32_GLOC7|nr:STAS domain-containing protein [Gloeothece citriformis]ACK68855.1 anti-sigma-factor antagonist [Gloeothece citriformis PCC 7424]
MRSMLETDTIVTLEPTGYLTAANITQFQEQLTLNVSDPEKSIFLVDMTQVEFLDSAGLMALASACRLAQSLDKQFSICSIPPSVKIIFELTQLDRFLDIYDNRETFEATLNQTQDIAA